MKYKITNLSGRHMKYEDTIFAPDQVIELNLLFEPFPHELFNVEKIEKEEKKKLKKEDK